MIKSMTAYASCEKTDGLVSVAVEIRSYNSRYLDLVLRIPGDLVSLEEKIRQVVSQWIQRGRIELKIVLKNESEQVSAYEIDIPRAVAYHDALVQLKQSLGLQSDISLELMTTVSGIIKPADTQRDPEACWKIIYEPLCAALKDHENMRKKEGDFIALDFEKRLQFIEDGIKKIKEYEKDLPDHYRKRLEERIGVLTKGMVEIDPVRIAQEAAFLADRSDISEEIVRSESHIGQFQEVMNSGEPAGRKLNFLLQETNREFNTMGVKAQSADSSHVIVSVKAELEKIREQVQNVE
ncbi:MAG: YicC/YloC family endoribonuclease [Desulfobacterales bacterium]